MTNQITSARQSGFVLPIGMIMLLILSIIGISTMRDGILQEKMSSNFIDKEKSFQAAESALRMVQRITLRTSMEDIESTAAYHSSMEDPLNAPDYGSIDIGASGFQVTGVPTTNIYSHPVAMIEELTNTDSLKVGKAPVNKELAKRYFRISALATGDTARAKTALQSVVSR